MIYRVRLISYWWRYLNLLKSNRIQFITHFSCLILEGDFRAVLHGNAHDELEICLESGDPSVKDFEGRHLVYVSVMELLNLQSSLCKPNSRHFVTVMKKRCLIY